MTKTIEVKGQVEGLMKAMNETMDILEKKRKVEAEAHVMFERSKEEANRVARARMMELANDPDVATSVDPRTGKSNEEWRKWVIEAKLEGDEEFMDAMVKHNNANAAYLYSQADMLNLSERIGTLRTQAILLSSLLRFESASAEE